MNIEVDGEYHRTIKSQRSDYLRDRHSKRKGFETIRVTNGDINYDIEDVVNFIEEIMEEIKYEQDDKYNFY